ncbi:hypothetical protein [Actinomyces oris]|nr:hypothetical protein [Actinomyces oris]WCA43002.1 hypothetical protein PGE45_01700 [Actinomyces oris]
MGAHTRSEAGGAGPAAPAERACLTAAIGDDPPSSDTDELRP